MSLDNADTVIDGLSGQLRRGAGWPILPESRLLTRLPHPSRAFCGRVGSGHEHDTHSFSPPPCPLRFDLVNPFRPPRIVNKTTPFPVLWPLHQSSLYRIAMDVPQLLDAFRFAPPGKSPGGPLKPDFGLSGALRQLDRVFPLLVRAGVRSIRTRFQLVPRCPLRDGGSCSTASLRGARTIPFSPGSNECSAVSLQTAHDCER